MYEHACNRKEGDQRLEVANVATHLYDGSGLYLRVTRISSSFLIQPLLIAAILAIFIAYDFYEPE